MNVRKLKLFCNHVENVISSIPANDFPSLTAFRGGTFPRACCGDTSNIMASLIFDEFDKIFGYFGGRYYGYNPLMSYGSSSHAWLVRDGILVDITISQFNDRGYHFPKSWVGKSSKFHKEFEEQTSYLDGRHFRISNNSYLNVAYNLIKSRV